MAQASGILLRFFAHLCVRSFVLIGFLLICFHCFLSFVFVFKLRQRLSFLFQGPKDQMGG